MRNFLKVSAFALLELDALEQGLEVAGPEALMVATLNDLDEDGRAVLERFRENLEKIAMCKWLNSLIHRQFQLRDFR